MDPDKALKLAREEATKFIGMFAKDEVLATDDEIISVADQLVEHFVALDEWVTSGGSLPGVWKQNHVMGRPRRTSPGLTLPGVTHGTRGAYNQGCRCMPCTGANRSGGAAYRAKKKEKANVT